MKTRLILCLLVPALIVACAPSDPKLEAQKQRSRWTVQLLSWAPVEGEAQSINVGLRVSGPPNSPLEQLTYRISLLDAANETLIEDWRTIDLSTVERGGPKDIRLRLDTQGHAVEGLAVDLLLQPTPEEERKIPELQF